MLDLSNKFLVKDSVSNLISLLYQSDKNFKYIIMQNCMLTTEALNRIL